MTRQDSLTVGVIFGGQSVEHAISLISAQSVADALATAGHKPVFIYIDKDGLWKQTDRIASDARVIATLLVRPGDDGGLIPATAPAKNGDLAKAPRLPVDVCFPVLHGACGEDGMVQGLLASCGLPYVGAGIPGSAVTNDKDLTKRLLIQGGLQTAPYLVMEDASTPDHATAVNRLGSPLWVKPANLGSSLGIRCVETPAEYEAATKEAFALDHKVLLEKNINGRELECSILHDKGQLTISRAGEIIVDNKHHFYDYDAKYNDLPIVTLKVPTELPPAVEQKIKMIARRSFDLLEGRHIMRLDLFLDQRGEILVNEIQTIPGFTSISMYPKLLAEDGIPMPELIDRLVRDAYQQGGKRKRPDQI